MEYTLQQVQDEEYPDLIRIWESSVKATHHFLEEKDFIAIKQALEESCFFHITIWCAKNENGIITGFAGISGKKLEMLFVDAAMRGKGVGEKLLQFAINDLGVHLVDVNEQNEQAIGFYKKYGFKVIRRNETDGEGRPYPILEMSLS